MGASADRILHEIKTRGPARTADLAGWLGMTAQGARQQLERLAGEALVEARDEKRGVGRPHRVWSLTELGDARFPDGSATLDSGKPYTRDLPYGWDYLMEVTSW